MRWQFGFIINCCLGLIACSAQSSDEETLAPGKNSKWQAANFEVMVAGSYNYTSYDIFDVFILPVDKNNIDYAASLSGGVAARPTDDQWNLTSMGPNFAWDYRWPVPKQFKVWWFQVIDPQANAANGNGYDKYTSTDTAPGGEWCQAQFEVREAPKKGFSNDLVLHFFPDGHVEANIYHSSAATVPRVVFKDRSTLPRLKGRTCLHVIANPYFGQTKPVEQY